MNDETSFQELMQRYNRELLHMQKKAQGPDFSAKKTMMESAPKPGSTVKSEPFIKAVENCPEPPAQPNKSEPPEASQLVPVPAPQNRSEGTARGTKQETIQKECHEPDEEKGLDGKLHSLTVGDNSPVLLQDSALHERLELFANSTQRPRAMHVKGYGAFGYFQPYQSMKEYTCAAFLNNPAKKTPVFVRFSQGGSMKGSPDTARDVRGFATKFYTEEGNYDIVGNHIPVFFVRDAIQFPEAIAAIRPSPVNNLPDPKRFWGFAARTPETAHMITWLYSDLGTVDSYRHIRGYGVNTFVWKNAAGERRYVKYHWIPMAGERCITRQEAVQLAGENPDAAGEDLYRALQNGTVEYELCVQLMDPADAPKLPYDPLDDTKVWSEVQYPLLPVGKMTLNRNPDDYLNQVEKAAFSPANLVEGVELSADKMLQGRSFIYWDAQRRRLGTDFRDIPVNRSPGWTAAQLVTSGAGQKLDGTVMRAGIQRTDDFTQAGERYLSLPETQKEHLAENIALELYQVSDKIQREVLEIFKKVNQDFAERVNAGRPPQV